VDNILLHEMINGAVNLPPIKLYVVVYTTYTVEEDAKITGYQVETKGFHTPEEADAYAHLEVMKDDTFIDYWVHQITLPPPAAPVDSADPDDLAEGDEVGYSLTQPITHPVQPDAAPLTAESPEPAVVLSSPPLFVETEDDMLFSLTRLGKLV
jgi:hypothetical protein